MCILKPLAAVSYNTHFLLSSGGSFMSFCILKAKTVQIIIIIFFKSTMLHSFLDQKATGTTADLE